MKNKGFTLVEMIVAMVVSSVLAVGIVSLVAMTLTNYRNMRIEAQVQIEAQTISEYIKSVMHGCEEYHFTKDKDNANVAYLAVKTRPHIDPFIYNEGSINSVDTSWRSNESWYYFYFDLAARRCYVVQGSKLDTDDSISSLFTEEDKLGNSVIKQSTYLGQYVESINITPNHYSYNNKTKIKEYNYGVVLQLYLRDVDYEQQFDTKFKVRSR